MQVTKYPQSCLVVEVPGTGRLLLDPGGPASARHELEELLPVDAVLVTHRHPDHLDGAWAAELLDRGIPLVTNADVAGLLDRDDVTVMADGDRREVAGVAVRAVELAHMPMIDGTPGPPNLGFLLDDRLLHPGDGVDLRGLHAQVLAAPLAGPSCSYRDTYVMIETVGATTAIPIHYDVFPADPALFADKAGDVADVRVLAAGETTTLT
jgi:L-ascorbate metabolism protein UlaG (beta-lactamase superfamily)